ncbi:hypothetical protein XELAEV_18002999mg [Xenopus laevis]|nr:hypothetical protein XELAEV_18002999mg [Xenopus laevis]
MNHSGNNRTGSTKVDNRRRERGSVLNINRYATKKSLAESMLDVALFMANATQLKAVLEQGPSFTYYITLITLISISLVLQVIIGILLIIIGKHCPYRSILGFYSLSLVIIGILLNIIARKNLNDVSKQPQLNLLNNVATGLVFLTVLINIFITAFGVQKTGLYPSRG